MAIDSAEKRRSISGVGFVPLIPGVTPNSAKDAEWRAQSAWSYSGGEAAEPAPVQQIETGYPWHVKIGRGFVNLDITPTKRDRVTIKARALELPKPEPLAPVTVSIVVSGYRDSVALAARVEQPLAFRTSITTARDQIREIKGRAYWDDDDEILGMVRLLSGR